MRLATIDTNVLFEGLTREGDCGDVIDAWVAGSFTPCVSTALALEYEATLTTKLGAPKRAFAVPAMQALLKRAAFVPVYFSLRPTSPDVGDDMIIECAFASGSVIVTRNLKDLSVASSWGVPVFTPAEFLELLP